MDTFLDIKLPLFMPDATLGTVRTLTSEQVRQLGVEMLVVNTFHLYTTLGIEGMKKVGGIKKFMNWNGRVLSDSGGFQVYSLIHKKQNMGKITPYGAYFKSPVNGEKQLLTPENSIDMQVAIGSDVLVALDDCRCSDVERKKAEESVALTSEWAKRAKARFEALPASQKRGKKLFAVVQGGNFEDLRKKSAENLIALGFDGYCFGGWPISPEGKLTTDILGYVASLLPDDKPKYAMGIGTPDDIRACVKLGYNMFDCVIPTRNARHGLLYLDGTSIRINESKYRYDLEPIEEGCDCETCKNYSRAYLFHLFRTKEQTGRMLATIHNLRYYERLVEGLR